MTNIVYSEMPKMMKKRLQSPPHEVYSLHRKLSGAYLICIKLGAKVNCREIFDEVLVKASTIDRTEQFDFYETYLGKDYVDLVRKRDKEILERIKQFN